MSATAAAALGKLSREEQKPALDKLIEEGGGQVTVKTAQARMRAAKTNGHGDDAIVAPSKRLVNRVLKLNKKEDVLTSDFVRGVMWVLGDVNSGSIKGLRELERRASEKKAQADS